MIENTKCYAMNVGFLKDPTFFEKCMADASQHRKAKVDAMRFPEGKRLSLGAEVILKAALHDAGLSTVPLNYSETDKGKPYLKQIEGLHFNLSHSGEMVFCATAPSPVGCDIEIIRTEAHAGNMKLARRFFAPAESEQIAAESDQAKQNALFYQYWTMKESFIKAIGKGLSLPLNSFTLLATADKHTFVVHSADYPNYVCQSFTRIPGYACAVCRKV